MSGDSRLADPREPWLRANAAQLAAEWFAGSEQIDPESLAVTHSGRLSAVTLRAAGPSPGYPSYLLLFDCGDETNPRHVAVYVPDGDRYSLHSSVGDAEIDLPPYWPPRREDFRESAQAEAGVKPSVLRNLLAAVPLLLLSGAFFATWRFGWLPPWTTRTGMTQIMQLEFLAVHSGVFFWLLASWQPRETGGRNLRWVLFALMLGFYSLGTTRIGWHGALALLGLILGTYLGWMLNRGTQAALWRLFGRWLAMTLLFIALAYLHDLPRLVNHWTDNWRTLPFGAWYFLGLGLMEATGFYQLALWAEIARSNRAPRR